MLGSCPLTILAAWDHFLGGTAAATHLMGKQHASAIPKTHPKESFPLPSTDTGPSMSRALQNTAQQYIPHKDLALHLVPIFGQCYPILPQPPHSHVADQEFDTSPV